MSKNLFFVVLFVLCFLIGCSDKADQMQNTINEQHLEIVVLYILLPVVLLAGVFIGTVAGAKARRDSDKGYREKENG